MTRSIFEAEFVPGFDRSRAWSVKGRLVDIRIVERWCDVEETNVAALKRAVMWHRVIDVVKWVGIALFFMAMVISFFTSVRWKLFLHQKEPPTEFYWMVVTPVLGALALVLLYLIMSHVEKPLYWNFVGYVANLRKQIGLSSKSDLDQDPVQFRGDIEIEETARALMLVESDTKRYVTYIVSQSQNPDRHQLTAYCQKWESASKEFSRVYQLYCRAYATENQGMYMKRVQSLYCDEH